MPRKRAVLGVGMLGGLLLTGPAAAQSDLDLSGSLTLAGIADDNLFATPGIGERDTISRLTPAVEAACRSQRASLVARYAFDAERFADHPELDTARARQNASIDLSARPSRFMTLLLRGDYVTTLAPGELNLTTGLSAGRLPARRIAVSPTVEWRAGPVSGGRATWALTKDEVSGGVTTTTGVAALVFERRLSPRDTGSVGYTHSRFDFESGGLTAADTLTLGWERSLGLRSGFALRGGPRLSDGRVDPEISIVAEHGSKVLQWSLTLARSLGTVIGRDGPVLTDSVQPAVSIQPLPSLRVRAAPGVFRVRDARGGPHTTVYVADVEAAWRLGGWLSFVAAYRRSLQEGTLDPAPPAIGLPGEAISHGTFLVSLVAHHGGGRAPAAGGPPRE